MLRETREMAVPELGAWHHKTQVRTSALRMGVEVSRGVASDFGVLDRGARFSHLMDRPCLTLLWEGRGRLDEEGQQREVPAGSLVISDQRRGGTEAYAGASARWLVLDWDPAVLGAPVTLPAHIVPLRQRTLMRLEALARQLLAPDAVDAAERIVDVLRAEGLPFTRGSVRASAQPVTEKEQRLVRAVGVRLSHLSRLPAVEEVAADLGTSARQVHRAMASMARRHAMPWTSWRSELRRARLLTALRLLSAVGATTEGVARLSGFRSAVALCHAFDDAGLPSPGTFARDARRDVLAGWAPHARSSR